MTIQPTNDRTNSPTKGSATQGDRARATAQVDHPTPQDRAARGKAARAKVPRSSHAGWDPPTDRREPVDLLEEQADVAGPRARAGPVRQDAHVALRVLSGGGLPHGRGPRRHAAIGDQRPGLRRRARVELRPVRVPRTGAAVRHQRFRRDPPRSLGMGREAPRGEPRRRRAEQRVLRCRAPRSDHDLGRRVPDGDARVRVDAQPRRLVLTHFRSARGSRSSRRCSARRASRRPSASSRRPARRTASRRSTS